jgi:hypothetical protein
MRKNLLLKDPGFGLQRVNMNGTQVDRDRDRVAGERRITVDLQQCFPSLP